MKRGKRTGTIKHADIVAAFAERLKTLRLQRGLSQAELAEEAGIHVTYVTRLEKGNAAPGLDLLERLANALSVTLFDLVPTKPAATAEFLEAQARKRFESIIRRGDSSTIGALNVILKLMDQSFRFRR